MWRLELLCADDLGGDDDEAVLEYEATRDLQREAVAWAKSVGIMARAEDSDDSDSRHSDAYLYFEPNRILEVVYALRQIGVEGDILDVPSGTSRRITDKIAKSTGWTIQRHKKISW